MSLQKQTKDGIMQQKTILKLDVLIVMYHTYVTMWELSSPALCKSNQPILWFMIASKYAFLILRICLSPVHFQNDIPAGKEVKSDTIED